MQCSSCGFENQSGANYCGQCGAAMALVCPRCEAQNQRAHRFCAHCGYQLHEGGTPAAATSAAPSGLQPTLAGAGSEVESQGERRQLTVMFCDLVGSTALSERLDPEDMRELMTLYHNVCDLAVKRYEGTIAKFLGDGVLIYVGYPKAHEDDPVRAVKTAVEILERLPGLNETLNKTLPARGKLDVQVRIGIHTGEVVVGDLHTESFSERHAIVGHTPNVAARIQSVAGPNEIVVSTDTQKLIAGSFNCESLGALELKGLSRNVEVHRVACARSAFAAADGSIESGRAPQIGRSGEVAKLVGAFRMAARDRGQAVAVVGEAGIGKSLLIRTLQERLHDDMHTWLGLHCSPYLQDTPLHPLKEMLQGLSGITSDDRDKAKCGKLAAYLDRYEASELTTALAWLLGLRQENEAETSESPELRRKEALGAVDQLLQTLAGERPLVICVEDLHLADPSTLKWVEQLIPRLVDEPMLMVMTYRPVFTAPWATMLSVDEIRVGRLSHPDGRALVERLSADRPLPAEVVMQILQKADGIPLFIEELTKMVLELKSGAKAGNMGSGTLEIPATLRDSLMARLDGLAVDKRVTQMGAALGREFSYELIAALMPLAQDDLRAQLAALVAAELIEQRGVPPHSDYKFRQALIQETAYHAMLRATRRQVHRRIGEVLSSQFPRVAREQPEIIAKHMTEAGDYAAAITQWERAGRRALAQSANVEAVSHFERAVALVRTMDQTPQGLAAELGLQAQLGTALMSTRGYAAAEVERAFKRAWQLCQKAGAAPQLLQVRLGLWGFYLMRGNLSSARELAEECAHQAAATPHPLVQEQVQFVLGKTHFWLGELDRAKEHLSRCVEMTAGASRSERPPYAVQDPAVGSRSMLAMTLWLQGRRQEGLACADEALVLAEKLGHAFSSAFAWSFAALLYQLDGDVERTLEASRQGVAVCAEQGFTLYLALSGVLEGWAVFEGGKHRNGL
ncbi:MAG: adenylate/guanylate cyclase domain-containing protein, partial [Candidatus Hydrogenedentales bacterium]